MIVCHCQAVSDRAIRRVVREGAATCAEVSRACGAGGTCGGCRPAIEDIVDHEQRTRARSVTVRVPAFSAAS